MPGNLATPLVGPGIAAPPRGYLGAGPFCRCRPGSWSSADLCWGGFRLASRPRPDHDAGTLAAGEERARPGCLRRAARRLHSAATPSRARARRTAGPRGPTRGERARRSWARRQAAGRNAKRLPQWPRTGIDCDGAAMHSQAPYIRTEGRPGPLGRQPADGRRTEGSRLSACSGCA
jgi:hypothetical protein